MSKNHIHLAHTYWKNFINSNASVIDATCGNGHDTLFLANIVSHGRIYSYDIQKVAIERTKKNIEQNILIKENLSNIIFINKSHDSFEEIPAEDRANIKLIVYNLGYLPSGDKSITTMSSTTVLSIKNGLKLISPGGGISITCYPGHSEGKKEENDILRFLETLDNKVFSVCYHKWINKINAPSLIWITKII